MSYRTHHVYHGGEERFVNMRVRVCAGAWVCPWCVLTWGSQEKTTNRYQMDVNGVTITIVQTDNTTTRWTLLNNLVPTQVYDVVSGAVGGSG